MSEIPPHAGGAPTAPEHEVVRICRDLLRIDTSNYGPGQDGPGEREAADYVVVSGKPGKPDLDACWELGATVAAQLMD